MGLDTSLAVPTTHEGLNIIWDQQHSLRRAGLGACLGEGAARAPPMPGVGASMLSHCHRCQAWHQDTGGRFPLQQRQSLRCPQEGRQRHLREASWQWPPPNPSPHPAVASDWPLVLPGNAPGILCPLSQGCLTPREPLPGVPSETSEDLVLLSPLFCRLLTGSVL